MTYPTWICISPTNWRSVEELDGEPDFRIVRAGRGRWILMWRTSRSWAYFPTRVAAQESVREDLAR